MNAPRAENQCAKAWCCTPVKFAKRSVAPSAVIHVKRKVSFVMAV